jgi:septal ring factor EnvC (AmiA/AmiB activator)
MFMSELASENITTEIDEEGYKILNVLTMLNNENAHAYNNGDMSLLELSMMRYDAESERASKISSNASEIIELQEKVNELRSSVNAMKKNPSPLTQERLLERIKELEAAEQDLAMKLEASPNAAAKVNANKRAASNKAAANRAAANKTRKNAENLRRQQQLAAIEARSRAQGQAPPPPSGGPSQGGMFAKTRKKRRGSRKSRNSRN